MNKIYDKMIWVSDKPPCINKLLADTLKYASKNKPAAVDHQNWIQSLQSCSGFVRFEVEAMGESIVSSISSDGSTFRIPMNEYSIVAIFDSTENTIMAKLSI